jgi:F-type H+-transporting ATPase subunit a
MGGHGYLWFSALPFYREEYVHIYGTIVVMLILITAGLITSRTLAGNGKSQNLLPEGKFSPRDVYEVIIESILSYLEGIMGPKAKRFIPLIGTLFIYILVSNLLGLVPGFGSPTTNLNTNAACALIVFTATHYFGIKEQGLKYLKHFMGPIWWLAVLMVPLELVGHLVRPVSLSLRLFGNMSGDHMVLQIFEKLVPFGVPIVFLILGIFVSFIQALVFTLLTILYISGATEH